jgi:predicted O-linked N-acetylglucosamine transferase (SPINDLY family)
VRSHVSILQQVPNSILIHKGFCDLEVVRSFYQQECLKAGIAIERCRFMTRQPLEEDHHLFYQVADIALDTYPYNGGTHNLESLWFNLPIITLCGEQATSRMGYSFLKAVGISEGVAKNWDEYIEWGVKLGNNPDLRMELQQRLQQSKQKETLSPLWNPQKFAIDSYKIFESL